MVRLPPANNLSSTGVIGASGTGVTNQKVLNGNMNNTGTGNSNGVLIGKEEVFQSKNKTFNYPKDSQHARHEQITASVESRRQRSHKAPILGKPSDQGKPEGHFTPQLMMSS